MKREKKIIRAVTVSMSVDFFASMIPDLQKKGFEIVTVSSDGPELEHIRSLGAKTTIVDMYRRMSPVKDFLSLVKALNRSFHDTQSRTSLYGGFLDYKGTSTHSHFYRIGMANRKWYK